MTTSQPVPPPRPDAAGPRPHVPAASAPRTVLTGLLAGAARYAGSLLAGWVYARWHD